MSSRATDWHAFISHASEDKDDVARPLARLLTTAGLRVWLDEGELTIGDSLRRKIDDGLARSQYGIVILSVAFFSKDWPRLELDALASREEHAGRKIILPIWHGVDKKAISQYSPLLADRLAASTDHGLDHVAAAIRRVVGGTAPGAGTKSEIDSPPLDTSRLTFKPPIEHPLRAVPDKSAKANTFEILLMDLGQEGRKMRVLARYDLSEVAADVPLRADRSQTTDGHGARFGRIIAAHERIKSYTSGSQGEPPDDESTATFATDLFEMLFPGDVRRLYNDARAQHGRWLDLLLKATTPWLASG